MEKKLSEYIEAYRIDRPDEWTMDEFVRKATKLESERNALAAQVEALRAHRKELLDLIYNCAIGQVAMGYVVDAESLAQSAYSITGIDAASNKKPGDKTPQRHLRQVRADAGRDGFVAGYFHYKNYGFQFEEELEAASNQHHASILAGKE